MYDKIGGDLDFFLIENMAEKWNPSPLR